MITDDILALRNRFFDTIGDAHPDLLVLIDNQGTEQVPADQIWCRFSVRPGSKTVAEGGDTPRYIQLGVATLQVFVPAQMGDTLGYQLADECDQAFRAWRSDDRALTAYETAYQIFPSQPVQIGKNVEANYFQINFTILWRSMRG